MHVAGHGLRHAGAGRHQFHQQRGAEQAGRDPAPTRPQQAVQALGHRQLPAQDVQAIQQRRGAQRSQQQAQHDRRACLCGGVLPHQRDHAATQHQGQDHPCKVVPARPCIAHVARAAAAIHRKVP
ncbi:hypothetical protein G6F45_013945 [Rhizopus arrhizus]|nr:hypothetical protein G6F45_013945 [Rhizopus arrhizus]